MSYIDQNLTTGESVVRVATLHWMIYSPAIGMMSFIVAFYAFFIFGDFTIPISLAVAEQLYLVPLLATVIAFLLFVYYWLQRISTEFFVTNQRVGYRYGIIAREFTEIKLDNIDASDFRQDVWGRIFSYGTISITAKGGSEIKVVLVEKPNEITKSISAEIEARRTN